MKSTGHTSVGLLKQFFVWCAILPIFATITVMSAQPSLFTDFQPFSHIHLMFLYVLVMLSVQGIPLSMLFLMGIFIDILHGQPLASSSLLFLALVPLVQLLCSSNKRFSVLKTYWLFVLFLGLYILVQNLLQTFFYGIELQLPLTLINYSFSLVIFPILYGISILLIRRLSRPSLTTI